MFLPPRDLDARLAWLNGAHTVLIEVQRDPKAIRRLLREIVAHRQEAMDMMDRRADYRAAL